jgi:polyhydroxyalkanoate depolymerase
MLPEHDVFITDWHNARDVAPAHGRFGFDDYVAHLIRFLEAIGPGTHVVAVCQPCVAALVAASVMAQADSPAQPRSMTLMAGPIDTRVNPTKVNALAKSKPIDWFEQRLIARVPHRYSGGGRQVYPGFVQLAAFMSMNIDRHIKAHRDLYENLANGNAAKAAQTKAFYDEYFAVLDLTAEFYLETVQLVFQEHALPLGVLSRTPLDAPGCSRWKERGTISARSARRWRRTIFVRHCGPIASDITCKPAWAIMVCSRERRGSTRSIRW